MNWFYNLNIRTRLLAGFILIALISGAIGYIGVQKIHEVNERGAFLYRNMTVPLSQISNIATDYQRVRVNIRDVIIAKEPSEIQANIDQINKLKTKIDKEVQAFAVLIGNEDVQRAYNDLVKARQDYDSYLEQICILSKANHDEEAFALLNGDAKVAADAEREAIDKLVHLKVIHAKETADMNTSVANASSKEMELFLALGVGLALFLGIFISRSIVKPTAILQKELDKLAEKGGDLTQDIDVNSKDELGDLGRAVNKFIANLRMIMMEVTNSSNSVAATAQQLKSSAEQTTDSVNETAATMNEISTTVEQVSDSLQHISYASEVASGHASEGNQGINKLIEQMENISNSSHEAAQVINYLSTKSHEIGQIVELINAIAGQTNMLALNAAIEAARAGEQGRGFAVVAEEVKKLAEQSANAAKQIKELINAIQLESQNAVDKVAAGGKDVETGILVVHEVGESFKQIISAVQGLTAQMQEVTSATEEMASGVQNIAASTEEQTAAMEEVSASAESLSTLADGLNNIVSKFKL